MENTKIQISSGIMFEKCSTFVWFINADAEQFMAALKTFLIKVELMGFEDVEDH